MKKTIMLCALFAFVLNTSFAQERTITGRITSTQDTLSIPGVAVQVVGTTIGTVTNVDGSYSLLIPVDAKQLKFSGVGLKGRTIDIGASDNIDVVMEPDILKLDEVVVTAIAISREKRSLGYATQQVTGNELTAGQNTNFIGSLQGKVSGVNVTSLSGAPGSSQRIVIRGGSSISRNNQPLLVVDGVPIDNSNPRPQDPGNGYLANDLNNQVDYGNRGNEINPGDIESVSVLKGPAATALYGSRASNGALIITTKKGKRAVGGKSKMDVTLNTNVTFSQVLKLPDFQNEFGQGDVDNLEDDRRENFSWGLPFDGRNRSWGQEINGQQRVKPYSAIPDNVRDFYDLGVAYNNSVSFAGGSEKSTYYLAFSSLNSKGVVPTMTYDKYGVRFNGSSELSNNFSTTINVNYSNINANLPTGGQQSASIYDQLLQTPRDIPIVDGKNQDDIYNKYDDLTRKYGFYAAYSTNPYFILNNFKNTQDVDRLLGNISISYNGWKWLSITDRFGGDTYSDRRYQKWKKYDYAPADESGLYSVNSNRRTYQGKYSEDIYNLRSYDNDLMFTFKRDFTKHFKASLLLGQNIRQSILTNTLAQTNDLGGLGVPDYYNLENSNGRPIAHNALTKTRNIGYYADLNLGYKSMLFLELTGRSDKSSTLPVDNNTYFYPSASASFVFSELVGPKVKDKILSYGKVRVSVAKVGNDATAYVTDNFYSVTAVSAGFGNTTFPFGSIPGFTVFDRAGNPDIKPEFTTASEIGTELSFLNDRLSVDFSYYMNRSTDQIISLPLPPSTGFTSKTINAGEIENRGIELGLKGVPISTVSGFKWELYGTYTKNTSKVISIYQGIDQLLLGGFSGLGIYAQEGQPYGAFYGVDLMTDPQGHVVVDSTTGIPRTTTNPVYLGNYQAKFIASYGTTITYKRIALNVLFDMKQGGVFYSRTKDVMAFVGTSKETTQNGRQDYVWPSSVYETADGQFATNTSPFHPYDYYTANIPSGQHIVDASYVKMREASITYIFPDKWISKTPFGSASVAVFGNNLFIWTAKENEYADPEQNSSGSGNAQGFEFSANPSQRNYGVDLKVTF